MESIKSNATRLANRIKCQSPVHPSRGIWTGVAVTKNMVRGQNRSGGPFLVAKNCPPGPEMCPLLVRPYQKWSRGIYKCQAHSENAILGAMDSFSNKAGDLMEEVYQYMTQKCYMYLLGCTEGRKRSTRRKAMKFVIVLFFFATVSRSFVAVLVLHYKLNFPFPCALLSTKVQQLRNKTIILKRDQFWQTKVVWGDHF